ncbi:energy transducer TonB [Prevotella sp.]|uniref:energy transducer TonB n=1 Tax=Prevotella sp. TaxID=59823 RepID=UPI0026002831|nr:energy transducer TonB [Prevotella sp.]
MKKIIALSALLLLLDSNLKAQNVVNPTNEKDNITILRAVGDDSTVSDKEKVYQVVEQQPSFPGGREELFKYLAYNVRYPIDAAKNKIEGRVLVTFVVEHDGSISNVNVANSVYPSLDKESIRVVSGMPKWIPGKANGKTVRVKYTIPITFRLN